jgi:replicative DNA helicase
VTGEITRWRSLVDPNGRRETIPWSELVAEFKRTDRQFAGKDHPGWSAAVFRGDKRGRSHVERVTALVLDYDGTATEVEVLTPWSDVSGFLHTTKSHTDENPSFRILLHLSRPVSAFEYDALWVRVNAHCGGKLDRQARDPSRFWFMPSRSEGDSFRVRELAGLPLDPDEWLALPDPDAHNRAPKIDTSDLDRNDKRLRRAEAYVSRMDAAVAGQAGHKATWAVACVLVKGFSLGPREALSILTNDYNTRCQPPWSAKELEHKIRQAQKAKLPDGYLIGDETPRRVGAATIRDHEIPPEPEPEHDPETGEVFDEPEREPGDDTDAIAQELAQPVTAAERYGVVTLRGMYRAVIEDLQSGKDAVGFKCGIDEIDEALGGFRAGNVTLLAAGTSFGKSSFGILVAKQNLNDVARPLVISVEDKLLLYSRRLVASQCNVNALQLRDRDLKGGALERILLRANEAPELPVFIDAVGKTVEWVAEAIRACVAELGTRLVIADYVQRFKCSKNISDRRNQVTYVAETLSDAIKNSNAAGILLSQLKRTDGKEPTMDDVKESGDLENMAEHVVIGWREMIKGNGIRDAVVNRKCNIPKNKDGPVEQTWIPLAFNEITASFLTTQEARFANRDARGLGNYDDVADNVDRRYGN